MFREAIYAILHIPWGPISNISLLRAKDKRQLQMWNHDIPRAKGICLHEHVAEMTRRQPNAPAVCAWDGDLTYNELSAQAGTLAFHPIKQFKIKPETMVAVCMDKSNLPLLPCWLFCKLGRWWYR